jgi:LPS-assembly protein
MAADAKKALAKTKMPSLGVIKDEGPVEIEADRLTYDREERLYQVHGNVEITKGNLSLTAEHGRLSADTNEMVAWGNVVLREGEDVLECERLEINLNTRRGKVYQGKLFLKEQNFHITGQEAEKLGESNYRIRQGSFTTCDASRPPWSFSVRELDIDTTGVGIAREPVFYVEDVPVFYFPVIPIPVKRERQTGFLLPVTGYSSAYGPQLKTAFYWNISKDMDSTLFVDYLGDRGFKEGIEFRYAFPRETTGSAKFYFINDKVYGAKRESFFLQHEQKLPSDFYLKGDINWVSDRFYPPDFPRDLPERSRIDASSLNLLRSVLFGGKNWEQFSLLVDAEHFDNLILNHNDETLQKYPQAGFYAYPQALFKTPFFFDGALSYVNFWRKQGIKAQRADLLPQISYPMRLFEFLKVTPNVALRETIYQTYNDPEGNNGTESRSLFEAGFAASTELYRVFETSSNSKLYNLLAITRWMNTIEPTVGYNYGPRVSQDRLPSFDATDRIPYLNEITYGFTTRLFGKSGKDKVGKGPYEYVRLKVFQGYSLGDPYERGESGNGKYFSNIRGELWMNFDPYLTFRGDAEFNPYRGAFDILDGLVRVKDLRGDAFQVEYRYTRDRVHELNLYAKIKTFSFLFLYGGVRYNLMEKWWVEMDYGAVFQAQCWSVGLLFENINQTRNGSQPREFKVEAYVTLLGVGSLGHIPRIMSL